jgi:acyl-CoA synthetase (AMP-forming)/AMP-acid ligase II
MSKMLPITDYAPHFARLHRDRPAIICGEHTMNYGELDRFTRTFVGWLSKLGLRHQDRVAYLGRNSDLFFPVFFGCAQAGAVVVPLNWRCTPPELAYMLEDSETRLLLVDPDFLDVATQSVASLPNKPLVVTTESCSTSQNSLRQVLEDLDRAAAPCGSSLDPSTICMQMYTSGTTGRPKGVLLSEHAWSVARQLELESPDYEDFTGDDIILSPMPNFHVGGISWMLLGLVRGCTCVLTPDPSPTNILELCQKHGVTRTFVVPTVIRIIVDEVRRTGRPLPKLKTIYYGAAPMGLSLLEDAISTFDCGFGQFYGMTEICGAAVFLNNANHDVRNPQRLASVGTALPGIEIEIRDVEGIPVGVRQHGEIWIKSPTIMTGYWRLPEATAHVLLDGWYRTGDGGYLDEGGYLYLTDRIKDMIISGGENVYPAEVEEALRRHPAVFDAAVFGRKDDKWGEVIAAAIELAPGQQLSPDALIAELRSRLAGYKIPREIHFVDALPRTASGKVQRGEVKSRFAHK